MVATTSMIHGQPEVRLNVRRQRLISALALVGGVLIVTGSLLPWFSLFAGLQSYAGVLGWNGRLLLATGILSGLVGLLFLVRRTAMLRWGIGLLGFVQLAGASVLLLNLLLTYRTLAADPLLVAALGPGLFIVLAGAACVFGTLFIHIDTSEDGLVK